MCKNCGGQTEDSQWGPWCDVCGGVFFKPGQVFFRHVATVEGEGGRFPIIYDISTSDYAFMHKEPNPSSDKTDMDGFHRPRVQVSHGTLDAVIALAYPDVRGASKEATISASPFATPDEKARVLLEF